MNTGNRLEPSYVMENVLACTDVIPPTALRARDGHSMMMYCTTLRESQVWNIHYQEVGMRGDLGEEWEGGEKEKCVCILSVGGHDNPGMATHAVILFLLF